MIDELFKQALEMASQDFAETDAEIKRLELRRTNLGNLISALRGSLGLDPPPSPPKIRRGKKHVTGRNIPEAGRGQRPEGG